MGGQDFSSNEKPELHPCRCAAIGMPLPSESYGYSQASSL